VIHRQAPGTGFWACDECLLHHRLVLHRPAEVQNDRQPDAVSLSLARRQCPVERGGEHLGGPQSLEPARRGNRLSCRVGGRRPHEIRRARVQRPQRCPLGCLEVQMPSDIPAACAHGHRRQAATVRRLDADGQVRADVEDPGDRCDRDCRHCVHDHSGDAATASAAGGQDDQQPAQPRGSRAFRERLKCIGCVNHYETPSPGTCLDFLSSRFASSIVR
jgi:hypothetical protein